MQNAERKRYDGTSSHPSIAGPFRRTVDETRRPARVHQHILLPSSKPQKTSLLGKDFYAQTRDAKNSTPSPMRTTKRVKNDTNTHTKICMIELLCDDFCLWSICTSSRRPLVLVPEPESLRKRWSICVTFHTKRAQRALQTHLGFYHVLK